MDANPCTTRLLDQNFGMCITPEDTILPFTYNFHGTNYYRPWKLFTEVHKDFGSTIDNSKDKMKITLDVQHFRPNEITVKVNDREIFIEGKHEERQDDHGFISRHFTRRYILPKDCESETVTSTLSADGVLIVTANKKFSTKINDNERVVPIKMSEQCPQNVEDSKSEQCLKNKESTVILETKKDDAKTAFTKNDLQMMLKEDHCRLLESDLLSEAVSSTEKLLSESRKETDELLKLISSNTSAKASSASGKLEEVFGECKSAVAELTEKASEMTTPAFASELSCSKNSMISETFESQEFTKNDSQMMLKEDHCRLLESDLLSEAVSSTEKLLSESRKETNELLKLISSNTSAKASSASGKLEEVYGECKSAVAELTEKCSDMTTAAASASEVSCSKKSMISEKFESQESSSSISQSSMSMQSSMKATCETMREMICDELKETAENV